MTSDDCGGAPNGVWAIDLTDNMVNEWKTGEASVIGLAFGTDGTVFATTTKGIAALEAKTLKVKQQEDTESATPPMVFKFNDKEYVVAANVHGHILVRDPATLSIVVNVPGPGMAERSGDLGRRREQDTMDSGDQGRRRSCLQSGRERRVDRAGTRLDDARNGVPCSSHCGEWRGLRAFLGPVEDRLRRSCTRLTG